jgi:hypothetical protein
MYYTTKPKTGTLNNVYVAEGEGKLGWGDLIFVTWENLKLLRPEPNITELRDGTL